MNCFEHKIKWWSIFLPNFKEFGKLCFSYDKTLLFFNLLLRISFYFILTIFLYKYKIIYYNYFYSEFQLIFLIFFVLVLVFNILSIMILPFRDPDYIKIDKTEIPKKKKDFIPQIFNDIDLEIEKPSCPKGMNLIR